MKTSFPSLQFSIHASRCLNRHHHQVGCQRCADLCAANALTLTSDDVQLKPSDCFNCGACVAACPTEVFVETAVAEDTLVKFVEETGGKRALLACPLAVQSSPHGKPAIQSWIQADAVIVTPRCLAALTPSQLLQMTNMAQRELWIFDSLCKACPLAVASGQIQKRVAEANLWLEKWGMNPSIFPQTKNPLITQNLSKWQKVTGQQQSTGRRSFFRKLVGLEALNGDEIVAKTHIPGERQRLQAWWGKIENKPKEIDIKGVPIANISIVLTTCTACGLCAKQCPTNALIFSSDKPEGFQIQFKAEDCLDCGICAQVCPETAVLFKDSIPISQLLADEPICLVGGPLKTCPTCQGKIAQSSVHTRCHICRHKKSGPHFLNIPTYDEQAEA